MARVTVEDCIEEVPNRFELVILASQRTRKIGSGSPLTVERDNDKDTIIALREIAEKTIDVEELREEVIRNNQRIIALEDDEDEDIIDFMDGEEELSAIADGSSTLSAGEEDISESEESGEVSLTETSDDAKIYASEDALMDGDTDGDIDDTPTLEDLAGNTISDDTIV